MGYLVDYLYEKIHKSVAPGTGLEDKSPVKRTQAELCDLFENHVYVSKSGYFLYSYTGAIWVYNGQYYEMVETDTFLKEVVKQTLKRLDVGLVYQKFSPSMIANECLHGMQNQDKKNWFKANRDYIVFNNGVLNVESGELLEFSKDYKTDLILDFDYDKDASSSLWDEKVVEIIPNERFRKDFQMWCGALLSDRETHKMEYVCFLIGPGSNGKSVITAAIANVFGNKYFRKFQPDQLLKDSNRMFNFAALEGAIANLCDDLKKENISATGFKSFASGEEFEARHPFGKVHFKVKSPMLLCCTNEMPPTTDDSWGFHRRNMTIQSTTRIRDEKDADPNLGGKLKTVESRKAIFNWIYQGFLNYKANGYKIPLSEDTKKLQLDLRDDSNSLRRWIRDEGFVKVIRPWSATDSSWKLLKDWYKDYKDYCTENGDNHPQITKSMSKIFREKGFTELKRRDGIWFCLGKLEDEDAQPQEVLDPFGNPIQRITPETPEDELPF